MNNTQPTDNRAPISEEDDIGALVRHSLATAAGLDEAAVVARWRVLEQRVVEDLEAAASMHRLDLHLAEVRLRGLVLRPWSSNLTRFA